MTAATAPRNARHESRPSTTFGRHPPTIPLWQKENRRQTACGFREIRGMVGRSGSNVVDGPVSWRRRPRR